VVTRFPYHVGVADGVNREEWAAIVRELLAEHTKGKKAPFARLVKVDPSTVDNWLASRVQVSEDSVRQVAEAFGLSPIQLLIQVGRYSAAHIPAGLAPEVVDEEQRRVIEDDSLSNEQKASILAQLEEMRDNDERLLAEQRERDKQRRLRELDLLIRQAGRNN
jgi:hypothetical protein